MKLNDGTFEIYVGRKHIGTIHAANRSDAIAKTVIALPAMTRGRMVTAKEVDYDFRGKELPLVVQVRTRTLRSRVRVAGMGYANVIR